jgi:sugar lactone lactonase YvrE
MVYEFGNDADAGVDDGDDPAVCEGEGCEPEGSLDTRVATLAGSWGAGFVDGNREVSRFNNPVNLLVVPDGRVLVADYDNHRVRVVYPDGQVSTLVEQPDFQRPFGLALSGQTLYVQTDRNQAGQQNLTSGTIWAVPVNGGEPRVVAKDLGRPRGLAVAAGGTMLAMADHTEHTISLLVLDTGSIRPLAGVKGQAGYTDAKGTAARFNGPYDVVVDSQGDLLVADSQNHRIRRVNLDGTVTTVAGKGEHGMLDGLAMQAMFNRPQSLAIDANDTLYVGDMDNWRIRKMTADGEVTVMCGSGEPGFHNGKWMEARFYGMEGIDVDGEFLFVADGSRGQGINFNRVRRVQLN